MDHSSLCEAQGRRAECENLPDLNFLTTILFAVVAGLGVANVYLAQPVLDYMVKDLAIDPASIGVVITLTQVGYALGLILLLPLGDLIDRRSLILTQMILLALALSVAATASSSFVFFFGMLAVGFLAVVAQVAVAFSATLAAPSQQGRVIGFVTSGIVIGILTARFVAGLISDLGGWRAVYLTSAALSLLVAALVFIYLPSERDRRPARGYFYLIRSAPRFFLSDFTLLSQGVLAFFIFASFSTFWTALVLPLRSGPVALSHTEIGLFGFVGIAGALGARGAGRLADRGLVQSTTGWALFLLFMSWGLIACLPVSVFPLLAGVVLLDLAVQAVHVSNQTLLLSRVPDAGSRLVGGYMVFYSIGSAVGAISSTSAFAYGGWVAVSALGAFFSASALIFWAATSRLIKD